MPDTTFRLDAAVLHDLIRLWLERNPPLYDWENQYVGDLDSLQYQEGLDVQNAQSRCLDVAEQFSDFLHAELNRTDLDILPYILTPECRDWRYFGYTDRPKPGDSGDDTHTMTIVVDDDGEIYGIDWTAAQYGYHEFPMILRLAIDPSRLTPTPSPRNSIDRYNWLWMDDKPPGTWERLTLEELGATPLSL